MPRGIYDRSHLKKPQVAAEKRAVTAKKTRRLAPHRSKVQTSGTSPKQDKDLVDRLAKSIQIAEQKKALKTFYLFFETDDRGNDHMIVLNSLDDVLKVAVPNKASAKIKLLVIESVSRPMLKTLQLSYTLSGEQTTSDSIQS